jgi:hypothetical protein
MPIKKVNKVMKMKILYTSLIILVIIGISACKSNDDPVGPDPDPIGTLKVTGTVVMDGQPVQGALVSVDDVVNWKSITASDGTFEINGLTEGNHNFTASKSLEQGKIVQLTTAIAITDPESDIGTLELPLPVTMNEIVQTQVTDSSIAISWERSINADFVEYKVYRRDSPGLDEKLVFSSTNIDEIDFVDNPYRTGKTYYYRIYSYLQNGRIAGSNIVSTAIPEVNLIFNADFEQSSNGLPDNWIQMVSGTPEFDYFQVSSENKQNGNTSLRVIYIDSLANPAPGLNPWGGLMQRIEAGKFLKNEDYAITFWTRSEIGNMQVRLTKNSNLEDPIVSYIIPNDQAWTSHTINFRVDADTEYMELWVNTRKGFAANGQVRGWVDNMKLIK